MALIQIVENKKKSLGIYVHIPFCRSKCEYCDFYSVPGARSRDLMDRYLDAVILHIREAAQGAAGYEVDTVYLAAARRRSSAPAGLRRFSPRSTAASTSAATRRSRLRPTPTP